MSHKKNQTSWGKGQLNIFGTMRLKKCFGTVRLKKRAWNHSQFLTSLKSQCLKWPTFGILFLLRLIYVSDNNMGQKRKQFQLATFSLHFIFCPWVAGKVVKTKEQMFPPGGWPCHTLYLGISTFCRLSVSNHKLPLGLVKHISFAYLLKLKILLIWYSIITAPSIIFLQNVWYAQRIFGPY